jgi:hypothetical protein
MAANDQHFFMMDEDAFFYINLGTEATPNWVLMDYAEEVSIDMSKSEIDLPIEGSNFKLARGGDFEAPISFKYQRPKPGITDAIHDKIFDSFVKRIPVQFAWTDLAITDTAAKGFKLWTEVMKYPFMKKNEGSQLLDVEAKPTDYCESDVLYTGSLIGASA